MSIELLEAAVRAGLGRSAGDFKASGDQLHNTATGKTYFAKQGRNVAQILGEAEGLRLMSDAAPGLTPAIHLAEESKDGRTALFISDYIDLGRSSSQSKAQLAERLAKELHNPERHSSVTRFGFSRPTHCGVTEQDNTWEDDWMVFWRDRRLGDILKQIKAKRGSSANELLNLGRRIQEEVCPTLLSHIDPPPKPVLLHGDLWSGNVSTDAETGEPVIFDCSAYYGHNEADFGISHMFSTFDDSFYKEYYATLPRSQPHHEQRMKLYELYHHLNHYLMFGGSYASGALRIMQSLLSWVDEEKDA